MEQLLMVSVRLLLLMTRTSLSQLTRWALVLGLILRTDSADFSHLDWLYRWVETELDGKKEFRWMSKLCGQWLTSEEAHT